MRRLRSVRARHLLRPELPLRGSVADVRACARRDGQVAKAPYDLTRLEAVNETLKTIRDKYVDPDARQAARDAPLGAQLRPARRGAGHRPLRRGAPNEVTVRVETNEKKFRVDNVQGPWDVSARLREVFGFVQEQPARHRGRSARGRIRRVQRHAPHARPALGVPLARGLQGDEPLHVGRVRRPRHRHLDPRSDAHGHEPDAGHARPGGRGSSGSTASSRSTTSRRSTCRSTTPCKRLRGDPGTQGHGLGHRARATAGWQGSEAVRARRASRSRSSRSRRGSLDGGRRLRAPQAVPGDSSAELDDGARRVPRRRRPI